MSRGTAHRTIRVPDDLWVKAQAKAEQDGDNLSQVVRKALEDYAATSDDTRPQN